MIQHDNIPSKVKVDAQSFDGKLDPKAFLDWIVWIKYYFNRYNMKDMQRISFIKMKLEGMAKQYW